jgi:hypothetical protein
LAASDLKAVLNRTSGLWREWTSGSSPAPDIRVARARSVRFQRLWDLALLGALSGIASNTGRTHRATVAIMAPGIIGQPVRSISIWAT